MNYLLHRRRRHTQALDIQKMIFEQEMLKHVHDLKKDLREKGWWERESQEVSKTSFLRSENSDAELGFKFD